MEDFRKWAHLVEQLGEQRVNVLIDSGNTGEVMALCDKLINAPLPTEMTVGGRTYDILGFLEGDKESVMGDMMVARAKDANAHLGQEDGEYLLANQGDIPVAFQGKIMFVFTDWTILGSLGSLYYICWNGYDWVKSFRWLTNAWHDNYRVLRRKSA
ncbi:MAG: hypothetical protein Q7S48_04335 [bacterium]|nr:hypothetical protein [bacterium]